MRDKRHAWSLFYLNIKPVFNNLLVKIKSCPFDTNSFYGRQLPKTMQQCLAQHSSSRKPLNTDLNYYEIILNCLIYYECVIKNIYFLECEAFLTNNDRNYRIYNLRGYELVLGRKAMLILSLEVLISTGRVDGHVGVCDKTKVHTK